MGVAAAGLRSRIKRRGGDGQAFFAWTAPASLLPAEKALDGDWLSSKKVASEDGWQKNQHLSSNRAGFEDKWRKNWWPSSNRASFEDRWRGREESVFKNGLFCAREAEKLHSVHK